MSVPDYLKEEEEIISKLIDGKYNIKEFDTDFLFKCIILISGQMSVFYRLSGLSDDVALTSEDIIYSNGDKFIGNENDLLIAAQMAKIFDPILRELDNEATQRQIIDDKYDELFEKYLSSYAAIRGISI
jgi:hypothetical protein